MDVPPPTTQDQSQDGPVHLGNHVTLDALRARDPDATRSLCKQMQDRGIAVVRFGTEEAEQFAQCLRDSHSYFAQTPPDVKQQQRMRSEGEQDW
jgi:hypothetical protein